MVIIRSQSDFDLNKLNITEDIAVKQLTSKILQHRKSYVTEFNPNYNNFNGINNICKGIFLSLRKSREAKFKLPPLAKENVPKEKIDELELKSIKELDNILGIKLEYEQKRLIKK